MAQVLTMLPGAMEERGSLFGRLKCGVWQSEHFADGANPSAVAWPWKLSRYVGASLAWQFEQPYVAVVLARWVAVHRHVCREVLPALRHE